MARQSVVSDDEVRLRLAARGIDLEASHAALLAEVRECPPYTLLRAIARVQPRHGIYGYITGCRCRDCTTLYLDDHARRQRERRARVRSASASHTSTQPESRRRAGGRSRALADDHAGGRAGSRSREARR